MFNRLLIFVLTFTLLTGCETKKEPLKKQMPLIETVVTPKKLTSTLYFSGTISPISEAAVTSPADATVVKKFFDYGQTVTKNQLLLELDSSQLQKEYETALSDFLKAKDNLTNTKTKFVGTQALWKDGLVAKNSFLSEKSSVNNAEISFVQAKTRLRQLFLHAGINEITDIANLRLSDIRRVKRALQRQLNIIKITASSEGIILKPPKEADKAAELRVGTAVKMGQVLALIGDFSGLSLSIKLSEIDVIKIKAGMPARVKGVAFPQLPLTGHVSRVSAQASSVSGAAGGLPLFFAEVVVPKLTAEQQQLIKVGMSGAVEIDNVSKGLLQVNIDAVYQQDGRSWVNVKGPDGVVKKRQVTTGATSLNNVVILTGLKPGETVVWSRRVE